MIVEPRHFHAIDACELWDEHGMSLPSSYWLGQLREAEIKKYSRTLPVLITMGSLVQLGEYNIASEKTLTEYCDGILASAG